jgi:hypothetical protein
VVESDLCNFSITYLGFEIVKGFDFEIFRSGVSFGAQVSALLSEMVVVEDLQVDFLEVLLVSIRILGLHIGVNQLVSIQTLLNQIYNLFYLAPY